MTVVDVLFSESLVNGYNLDYDWERDYPFVWQYFLRMQDIIPTIKPH